MPISPGATPAEAAAQAELALESLAPFPLAQLYYGFFWMPGVDNALVFGAYRRRFTSEQTGEWGETELVIPGFAAALGAEVAPGTTLLLASAEAFTAVQWEKSPVPVRVFTETLAPDLSDDDRALARERLIGSLAGAGRVIEVAAPLTAEPAASDRAMGFRSGSFVSQLAGATAAQLDVRDKAELVARRNAARRDVFLWRVALGAVAALVLLAVAELGIVGARKFWQVSRLTRVAAQAPRVEEIKKSHALANRIDDLATKRLLPFEMIALLTEDNRKPGEITFVSASAGSNTGLHTLFVEAATTSMGQLSAYVATLRRLPMIQSVETREEKTRNDGGTFRLIVVFKPGSVKRADSIAP
ncbi:MAG: hypothetical protein Q8N18_17215 [Opitutaceae bacterium]|nr:hypothetical protein [Opitutaceae bacterium]